MTTLLVAVGVLFAVGLWGYIAQGDVFYMVRKLSASEILPYAAAAGFTGDSLTTAIAIALAESGGDPNAHGDTTLGSGTGSFGLWQVYSDAHPEYGPDFTTLYDPQTNAQAAFAISSQGTNFTPWSTYNNAFKTPPVAPNYTQYLGQAQAATGS